MKILNAAQTREADQQTISEENIASVDLMERAAKAFFCWFDNKFSLQAKNILICCGPGNNGGDGLAIARLLHQKNYGVAIWIVASEDKFSVDFNLNRQRLPLEIPVSIIQDHTPIPDTASFDFILDGLFGTGLSRPVSGVFTEIITRINASPATILAIDIPSGLYTDKPNEPENAIIKAHYTVSFELPKLAFFLAQNERYIGKWHIVPINLSPTFLTSVETNKHLVTPELVSDFLKPRSKFSHKGTYGHALLLTGSYGKMGAAVLASRACLRSGVGLLSVHCPKVGYTILQTAVPEAMTLTDNHEHYLTELPALETYQAIGAGPGLGKAAKTRNMVQQLLNTTTVPLVLDADALNIISEENLLPKLPTGSILTPHPKEFERLTGSTQNDYHRLEQLHDFCQKYQCYVVLKGGHTCIGTPEGNLYFNNTGNPGMATGGTGDVLTGIITALVAQKYTPLEACLLGVYVHGLAGDLAKEHRGEIALVASDLINSLGAAFMKLVTIDSIT